MKAMKGLFVVVALLLIMQAPALAIQPQRWASPAPREDTQKMSEMKQTEMKEGFGSFLEGMFSPFKWLMGGGKTEGK